MVKNESVGFLYGGSLKTGYAKLFFSTEKKPLEFVTEHKQYYGKDIQCRYINVEDAESVYKEIIEKISDNISFESLCKIYANNLVATMKEVSGNKSAHRLNIEKEETKQDKKSTKKASKKSKKSDNSSDEDGNEEDEQVTKKKSTKKKVEYDEMSSDDSDESEIEEDSVDSGSSSEEEVVVKKKQKVKKNAKKTTNSKK